MPDVSSHPAPAAGTQTLDGGRALARMLQLHGAGPLFGMGGFQLLPYYEAMRALGLPHHLINDERCGAFAADAYAKVTNRPGVCDGTLGPGATNLVTALMESLNAGTPQVVVIGGATRSHSGKNMTQEARQAEILRPAVKELIRVEDIARIPELVRRAYAIATSGRPGPVVLEVPEDVCHGEHAFTDDDFHVDPETVQAPARRSRPDAASVERAAALLAKARRPLLLVGGGIHISQAWDALQALAQRQRIPVAHTMSGKGGIACTHALSAGLFGRYSRVANELVAASDLLLVVGCKLGEIATRRFQLLPAGVPVVHCDISAEEFGRTSRTSVHLWGDARCTLEDLLAATAPPTADVASHREAQVQEMGARMTKWREEAMPRLGSAERPIHMARVIHELNRLLPADALLVADGGFAAHWASLLYDTKQAGRSFIVDRGSASIGYGIPGAIGAQLAAPGRPVVALTGDGGMNMTIGELETARRLGTPFTALIVNNAASGYIKALQHAMYGEGRYQSSELVEMDYARIATAMGCQGLRVEDPDELAAALQRGLSTRDRPTVIDVVVTRDPARMLPAVDSRTLRVERGDRPA